MPGDTIVFLSRLRRSGYPNNSHFASFQKKFARGSEKKTLHNGLRNSSFSQLWMRSYSLSACQPTRAMFWIYSSTGGVPLSRSGQSASTSSLSSEPLSAARARRPQLRFHQTVHLDLASSVMKKTSMMPSMSPPTRGHQARQWIHS